MDDKEWKEWLSLWFYGCVEGIGCVCMWGDCVEFGEFWVLLFEGLSDGGLLWFCWFCFDYVCVFNLGYNFFDGMIVDEIYYV